MLGMDMNAFDRLSFTDKLKLIKLKGELIATIGFEQSSVALYKLDDFLVEKYIDNTSKKTVRISSAKYLDLVKYLPHITITSIYKLIA
jgi:hypothetical protein